MTPTARRAPLPLGTEISFAGIEAVVLQDFGGSSLRVRCDDGFETTWYWQFDGETCRVVRLPDDKLNIAGPARLQLELSLLQAEAACAALTLYTGLCQGKLRDLGDLLQDGVIPLAGDGNDARQLAPAEALERIDYMLRDACETLGYLQRGSNSLSHPHVHPSAVHGYEVAELLKQGLNNLKKPGTQTPSDPLATAGKSPRDELPVYRVEFYEGEEGVGPFVLVAAANAEEAAILAKAERILKGLDHKVEHVWVDEPVPSQSFA